LVGSRSSILELLTLPIYKAGQLLAPTDARLRPDLDFDLAFARARGAAKLRF
jgi:hypothetical protein